MFVRELVELHGEDRVDLEGLTKLLLVVRDLSLEINEGGMACHLWKGGNRSGNINRLADHV